MDSTDWAAQDAKQAADDIADSAANMKESAAGLETSVSGLADNLLGLTNAMNELEATAEDLRLGTDERLDTLERNLDKLNDTVQLLAWSICEAGNLWLPISLTPNEPPSPSEAARVLSRRRLELRQERVGPGGLAEILEEPNGK